MHFLNYLLFGKQSLINSGLKTFLNISYPDKGISIELFKSEHPEINSETIDSYFSEYEILYDFAQRSFYNLSKYQVHKKQVKKDFIEAISNKHNWVDKPNMERLFDVCCFISR